MENARHRFRSAERVFRERLFIQIKTKSRLIEEREPAVDHAHRGEAEPFFPDLVLRLRFDAAANFLDQKVRCRCIHMNRGEATDGPPRGAWVSSTPIRRHLPHFPQGRDATHVIDIGLQNVNHAHLDAPRHLWAMSRSPVAIGAVERLQCAPAATFSGGSVSIRGLQRLDPPDEDRRLGSFSHGNPRRYRYRSQASRAAQTAPLHRFSGASRSTRNRLECRPDAGHAEPSALPAPSEVVPGERVHVIAVKHASRIAGLVDTACRAPYLGYPKAPGRCRDGGADDRTSA